MPGFVIYEGSSMLDGHPIVVVATTGSENIKTGDVVQTWILPQTEEPHKAVRSGLDASVCGDCPFRGGSCYVTVFQAPLSVWRGWRRGIYPRLDLRRAEHRVALAGRTLRMGSYGDPAAVPIKAWRRILRVTAGRVGYTHQWRKALHLRPYVMASVDTPEQAAEAAALGWRYFRTRLREEAILPGEIACPASAEGGRRTTCDRCGLCAGAEHRARNVMIAVHGAANKVKAYREWRNVS